MIVTHQYVRYRDYGFWKSTIDYCFNILGSSTIQTRKSRGASNAVTGSRILEMKESYEHLHHQCSTGVSVTARCRLASSEDLCRDDYASKACKVLHHFEYGDSTSAETILSALIRLQEIMSDPTDSIFSVVSCSQAFGSSLLQSDHEEAEAKEKPMINSDKKTKIPENSLCRVMHLLPTAASSLLTSYLAIFCIYYREHSHQLFQKPWVFTWVHATLWWTV